MLQKSLTEPKPKQCTCIGHEDFDEIIEEIKKKANFQESLETADDLYGIKKYNVLGLTPKRVAELYNSICHRVYSRPSGDHLHEWVGYELKIFVWLLVCHLSTSISSPEKIERQCWDKYSRIFHNKSVELIEYQAQVIRCGQAQPRKWQKHEENFLIEIMRSNQNKSKWNEIAKDLYLKSDRRYFRNPKQIRERWINHLDPEICKSEWTTREDHLIVTTVLEKGRKWALIAKMGGGLRTEHMIKNRYYALIRREEKNNHKSYDLDALSKKIKQKLQKAIKIENDFTLQQTIPLQLAPPESLKTIEKRQQMDQQIKLEQNDEKVINEQKIEEIVEEQQQLMWPDEGYQNKKLDELELVSFINYEEHENLYSCNDPLDRII